MQPERFRVLLESDGPFASVYFDDSHDTADAAAHLDITWRDLRKDLASQGAEPALLDAVESAVRGAAPPVGRSGRGIIANGRGVLLDEHLM